MVKDIPNFDALLEEGNVTTIREWLTENIHQYGKTKKPLEILEDVTGEGLNANYLADYLEAKYRDLRVIKRAAYLQLFLRDRKMEYTYTVMTQEEAEEIAYNWHYEGNIPFTI